MRTTFILNIWCLLCIIMCLCCLLFHYGYSNNREFKRFAPLDKQPKVDRSRDELSEVSIQCSTNHFVCMTHLGRCKYRYICTCLLLQHEKVIYDAFTSESYVARIIEYLCLEDKKGQDMFRKDVALIFRVHMYVLL